MRSLFLPIAAATLLAACTSQAPAPSAEEQSQLQMAQTLAKSGNAGEAVRMLSELAARSTHSVEPHLALAGIFRQMQRPADAVVVLTQAKTLQPQNATLLKSLAAAQLDNEQAQAAIHTLDELIALEPQNATGYNSRGIAFDKLGEHASAQNSYRQALALNPANASEVQNNLALSQVLNDQLDEAIPLLEKLVAGPDANSTMRQNLGLAYGLKGDTKRALAMNLKDLKPQEAKENLRFYEQYRKWRKANPASTVASPHTAPETPAPAPTAEPKTNILTTKPEGLSKYPGQTHR